jgi:hypothetical protein
VWKQWLDGIENSHKVGLENKPASFVGFDIFTLARATGYAGIGNDKVNRSMAVECNKACVDIFALPDGGKLKRFHAGAAHCVRSIRASRPAPHKEWLAHARFRSIRP